MRAPEHLVIATRASRLALWQARHVRERLQQIHPGCRVELLELTTRGDQVLDRSLSKIGGKGLFVKELETALLDGRADLAVHSLKDVPFDLAPEFALPVVLERDDPRDALVSPGYESLAQLPEGSVVGTSSLRREAQVRQQFPRLTVRPLRGNLDTRLAKLDAGQYDAIILAAVGLKRLGLAERIRSYLPVDDSLPSPGQGALGLEIRADRPDLRDWLMPLNCPATHACALAERAVSRSLGGSCQVPLAAYAQISDQVLSVQARVAEPDGSQVLEARVSGPVSQAQALGEQAAVELLGKGARAILDRLLGPAAH